MNKGYDQIFGGYLLVLLDLNIGSFDVLHDSVGYGIICLGLLKLYQHTGIKAFDYARIIGIIEVIMAIIASFFPQVALQDMTMTSYGLLMIGSMIAIAFVYLIYSGGLAHIKMYSMEALAETLGRGRTSYGLGMISLLVAQSFLLNATSDFRSGIIIGSVAVGIVLQVIFMVHINSLRKAEFNEILED